MGLILFITFIFFIWVGIKLVSLLSEEIQRQQNPHHYLSKESIAKQREETRKYYRNLHNQRSCEQFEKPRTPYGSSFESSSLAPIQKGEKLKPLKKEPQTTVDYKTQERLYTLVRGDMKAARRLLNGVKERNPRRSNQWHWEKVIYDLERDKRMF